MTRPAGGPAGRWRTSPRTGSSQPTAPLGARRCFVLAGLLVGSLLVPAAALAATAQQAAGETVAEVRVHGNHSIDDAEIIALAGVEVGSNLEAGTVEAIEERLRGSGRFASVEVLVRFRSLSDTSRVTLILLVHERESVGSKLLFLPLLSYVEDTGFTFGGQAGAVDLLGLGERISVPLTWGGVRRAALRLDRDFRDGAVAQVGAETYVSRFENPHFETDDSRFGVRGWVDGRIADRLRLRLTGEWADVGFGAIDERFAAYGATLSWDTRPDVAYPYDSIFASVGWRRFDVQGGAAIDRLRAELQLYLGIYRQIVLAVRGVHHTADAPLPPYRQPYVGGAASLRGHEAGRFAGDNVAFGSAELRVPVTSPLGVGRAGFSLFVDAAAAYLHGVDLRDVRFARGAGVGVFLLATVVRLNLDLGFDLEGGQRLHFATGFRF